MFLLVTGVDRVFMTHIESDMKSKVFKKTNFHFLQKMLSHGWYSWGVWETWWKSPMQTGQFLLVTDTQKRVRWKIFWTNVKIIAPYCGTSTKKEAVSLLCVWVPLNSVCTAFPRLRNERDITLPWDKIIKMPCLVWFLKCFVSRECQILHFSRSEMLNFKHFQF